MPNIEIHGLTKKPAETIASQIFNKLREKPYVEDVVVTICPTTVINITGTSMPFLRVVSTPVHRLDEIIEILKTLDMDIESQELRTFYTKREGG